MTRHIEVGKLDHIIGLTTKGNCVKLNEQVTLREEAREVKTTIQYQERFTVLEPFRNLIADPLYSPGHLWGQVDPALWKKNQEEFMKHTDIAVQYLRNIILLYNIGLELEAFYLWSGFKKKRDWLKNHLGSLVEEETLILKILDNPPFKIKPKVVDETNAIEMTYAHWGRQMLFLRGHYKKETTKQASRDKRAPWHTEVLTWNNRGKHKILSM